MHVSTTHWSICNLAVQVVKLQSDVIFNDERNANSPFQHGDKTDSFEVPEQNEFHEEIVPGGDGLPHDHAGTSRAAQGNGNGDDDYTAVDTNHC